MMVEVMLPAVSAPSPWVLGTASGIMSFSSAVFAVVVSPPPSIMAVVEDPVEVVEEFVAVVGTGVDADVVDTDDGADVVVGDITVTFIAAQTLRPLPRLPPHTYSSISHFHVPESSSPAMNDIPHSLSLYFP